jgi:hypothetical protein
MIALFVLYNIEVTNRDSFIKSNEYTLNEHLDTIKQQQNIIEDLKIENQILHDSIWHLNNNILKLKQK